MSAPTLVGVSTPVVLTAAGTYTVTAHVDTQNDDILILVLQMQTLGGVSFTAQGLAYFSGGFYGYAGTSPARTSAYALWKRASGGDFDIDFDITTKEHLLAFIISIRGCPADVVPYDVNTVVNDDTSSTIIDMPSVYTTVDNAFVVHMVTHAIDSGSSQVTWSTNTSALASITEAIDSSTATGDGGGASVATGVLATAGATGSARATLASASASTAWTFSFVPAGAPNGTSASSFTWSVSGSNVSAMTGSGSSSFGFSSAGVSMEEFVGIRSHLSLGGHEYLVRPGSYVKRQAPQFGARFTTGDPGLNNLSFWQHWAQRNWIGGVDQDVWSDASMYDQGVGVDTTESDKVRLARGLSRGAGANWTLSSGTTNALNGYRSIVYNSTLYVVTLPDSGSIGHLWQYNAGSESWSRIVSLDASNISTASIAVFDGKLYIGGSGVGTTIGKLVYSSGDLSTWATVTNPVGLDTVAGGNVTGVAATDILTSTTAHGFAANDAVRFSTLTGGSGLAVVTTYYVLSTNLATTTFMVSATVGGAAVNFTTDVTAGTVGKVVVSTISSMRAFQQKLYVSFDVQVWRMSFDQTWDGSTIFYRVNLSSESDGIVSMATHFGYLYMLSQDGHIHRTDGSATFDIWSWDGQTEGIAIKSFDGRLFILMFEYSSTPNVGYGVLYQMSGSAVTQLKRWGNDEDATRIGNMTVYDRRLFYGASNLLGFGDRQGFGLACYDPTEDAHSISVSNSDSVTYPPGVAPNDDYIVDDQEFFEGNAFVFVRGFGGFLTPYASLDAQSGTRRYDISASGTASGSQNGGWFTTSTYDAGTPGLLKLWRKITVDALIVTGTSVVIEYSIDDGVSWSVLATAATVASRGLLHYWLDNVKGTSLKLRFTLRSTDATVSPTIYAIQISYVPIPEPNWLWTFTLVLSESQQGLDGTTRAVDTEAEMFFLSALHRSKELVNFIDVDGLHWSDNGGPGVLIYDIEFRVAHMTQPLEGEVVVTLLEAVESYA